MNRIDWDWQAQLEACQRRIVELEGKIASERQKLQQLLGGNRNATFAQRTLAMREESLERVQSRKRLIETSVPLASQDSQIGVKDASLPEWARSNASKLLLKIGSGL